jgi:hypothetical protein
MFSNNRSIPQSGAQRAKPANRLNRLNRPTGQPANRPTGQPANRPTGQPANLSQKYSVLGSFSGSSAKPGLLGPDLFTVLGFILDTQNSCFYTLFQKFDYHQEISRINTPPAL